MTDGSHLFDMSLETYRLRSLTNGGVTNAANLAKTGFYLDSNDNKIKCFTCFLKYDCFTRPNHEGEITLMRYHSQNTEKCYFVDTVNTNRRKTFRCRDGYYFEKERLDTFIEWPLPWMSPNRLARSGLYYTRVRDQCICAFCDVVFQNWKKKQNPLANHDTHCPIAKKLHQCLQTVANVSMDESKILQKLLLRGEEPPMPECRYSCDRIDIIFFEKGDIRDRFASFFTENSNWPSKRVNQSPEKLAQAGFYYCGYGDNVRCFSCENGLHNWENDDDPWELHSRYYPKCKFVQIVKNSGFATTSRPPITAAINISSGYFNAISNANLKELLRLSRLVKRLLSNDYPESAIKETLKIQLICTGLPYLEYESWKKEIQEMMAEDEEEEKKKEEEEEEVVREEEDMKNKRRRRIKIKRKKISVRERARERVNELNIAANKEINNTPEGLLPCSLTYVCNLFPTQCSTLSITCSICFCNEIEITFLPCRHTSVCRGCMTKLNKCPLCRKVIKQFMKPIPISYQDSQ